VRRELPERLEQRVDLVAGYDRSGVADPRPDPRAVLAESLLLSGLGAVAGVLLGALVTGVYATSRGWITVVPPAALAGGLATT